MRLLVLFLMLSGCALNEIRPNLSKDTNYQHDLFMEVSTWIPKHNAWSVSQKINGMGVIPLANAYKVKVYSPGKADMLTLSSCHRTLTTPKPSSRGGFWTKKFYEFQYIPTKEHEVDKACGLSIGSWNALDGQHGWGFLVVDSEREKLNALVKCNGKTTQFGGTSVCQSLKGLIQSIHFDRPVKVTKIFGCEIKRPKDGKNWVFLMPEDECVLFFVDKKNSKIFHKTVLYGFDAIPIRGSR